MANNNSIITPNVHYEFGGAIKAGCVVVELTTGGDSNTLKGLIGQQVQASIQKATKQIYEIGTDYVYIVEGRASGAGSIAHLVGPNNKTMWSRLQDFANVCKPTSLTIGTEGDCVCSEIGGTKEGAGKLKFTGGFLNTVSIGTTSADWTISSNLGFTFYDVVKG